MKWIIIGFALATSLPVAARAQGLPAPLLAPAPPGMPSAVVVPGAFWIADHDARELETQSSQDTVRSRAQHEGPSMATHVLIGALGGLLVGGAVGLHGDRTCRDCMISVTPFTSALGAALGALVGLTVYNLRVHP